MDLIRHRHNIRSEHRGGVLTIGNFDGIHLGHQAMLSELSVLGEALDTHRLLMSFSPLPHEFFAAGESYRLMNLREKVNCLNSVDSPPDYFLLTRFDAGLAGLSADEFIEQILVHELGVRGIVIGDDFRFGKGRTGTLDTLQSAGGKFGFRVVAMSTHNVDNTRVSSTRVRDALLDDDLDLAARLLGRPYTIEGRVAHGDKLGRTIGFPTANIHLHRPATALDGVYAVRLATSDGQWHAGIANLGTRPTVDGVRKQLEVHLFDFDADIYCEHVCVSFELKIRDEQKFESFDLLKNQILRDCEQARDFHGLE